MGIFDILMGNNTLGDPTFASDMLKDSKFGVFALAKAVTETSNSQLRQLLSNHLQTSIQQHHQLSDLVMAKDWYQPFLAPQEQLEEDLRSARNMGQ